MTTPSAEPPVLFEVDEAVAVLTLNNPARLNPLTPELLGACLAALQRVADDPAIRVLVVKANGKGFCTGANLGDFELGEAESGADPTPGQRVQALLTDFGHRWVTGVRALRVPVLAAVHGAVAGGGVGFALACDFVVAARSAYFYLPFVPALGLVPDMGVGWMLPRAIGEPRAMALSLLGDRLSAEQAERWGLVLRCVDDTALALEVERFAKRLAALPPHGILEMRAMMGEARAASLPQFLCYEAARQGELLDGDCFAEGLVAFKERRAPRFPRP